MQPQQHRGFVLGLNHVFLSVCRCVAHAQRLDAQQVLVKAAETDASGMRSDLEALRLSN